MQLSGFLTGGIVVLHALWLMTAVASAPAVADSAPRQAPYASPQSATASGKPKLRVWGRHFVDPAGRVVILRGVNVSGGAKVPPFVAVPDVSDLDPLPGLGLNVVRLVFIWEAFEPTPGGYDDGYLARMRAVAAAAWQRGLYVIIDFHQDGFARCLSRGSGDGFPFWAVSPRAVPRLPDNGPGCRLWPVYMATDLGMHRSFADFHRDVAGVRTRYLLMLQRAAAGFATVPGVIGYDPINEPWGNERRDLGPLYQDAAAAIRSVDPTAILFVEGHVTTNCGLQTRLEQPGIENVVYAPHYYHLLTIAGNGWRGPTLTINRAFARMESKAEEWGVPLFLGEFGAPGQASRVGEYLHCLYDRLDRSLSSGAQWNYAPTWTEAAKDGWNGEDFNVLEPNGALRPNFPERPHPVAFAGLPLGFRYHRGDTSSDTPSFELAWVHRPERGTTEVFVPASVFPRGAELSVHDGVVTVRRDPLRQLLKFESPRAGVVRLRLEARAGLDARASRAS